MSMTSEGDVLGGVKEEPIETPICCARYTTGCKEEAEEAEEVMVANSSLKIECPVCQKHFFCSHDNQAHSADASAQKITVSNDHIVENDPIIENDPIGTKAEDATRFICSVCNTSLKTKSALNRHLKTIHSEERPHSCPKCPYQSKTTSDIARHLRQVHNPEKPFSCKQCGFRCKTKFALAQHTLIHSEEKPFKCPKCAYRSKRQDCVKRHIDQVHSDDFPFSCKQCKYRSKTRSCLTHHMVTHSKEKPFKCLQCTFKCKRKYELIKHMAGVHKLEKIMSWQLPSVTSVNTDDL